MAKCPMITLGSPDSFAVEDVTSQAKRVVDIIVENNDLSKELKEDLYKIRDDILSNKAIPHLSTGDGIHYWHEVVGVDGKKRWFGDHHHGLIISYFHRLLLDKVGYFNTKTDPYQKLKTESLLVAISELGTSEKEQDLSTILINMLWGNKHDKVPSHISAEKLLMEDHSEKFIKHLKFNNVKRLDIVADNAGAELLWDLVFIDYVLSDKLAKEIFYHVKNYPYNVSDTTRDDVYLAFEFGKDLKFIKRLKKQLNKKLHIVTYPFTTLGLDRVKAINVFKTVFDTSDLIVTKGDFNYRMSVGWYLWDVTDSLSKILAYSHAPILTIRAVKNEVLAGITDISKISIAESFSKSWWKYGYGGVILFAIPDKKYELKKSRLPEYWATRE